MQLLFASVENANNIIAHWSNTNINAIKEVIVKCDKK